MEVTSPRSIENLLLLKLIFQAMLKRSGYVVDLDELVVEERVGEDNLPRNRLREERQNEIGQRFGAGQEDFGQFGRPTLNELGISEDLIPEAELTAALLQQLVKPAVLVGVCYELVD